VARTAVRQRDGRIAAGATGGHTRRVRGSVAGWGIGFAGVALAGAAFACGGRAIDGDPAAEPAGSAATGGDNTAAPPRPEPGLMAPAAPRSPSAAACRDNPAAAGCTVPIERDPPREPTLPCTQNVHLPECPAPMSSSSEPRRDDAAFILMDRCGGCHTPAAAQRLGMVPPGPTNVLDWGSMLQEGYVADCDPEGSAIIQQLRSFVTTIPADEIQVVVDQIEMSCTAEQKSCALDPSQTGCAVVRIERILELRCGSCHGQALRQSVGMETVEGLSYIDDVPRLIEEQKILACQPQASPVLVRARDGSMPPATGGGYPFNDADVVLLTRFITGLCPGPANSSPNDDEQRRIESTLEEQCGECHGVRAAESGRVSGSLSEVGSIDALIRGGWLLPCAPSASPLLARLEDGSMPPVEATGPRPSQEDMLAIRAYLEQPCARP
jgi:mono/diheme cytochrome c family protein